MTLLTQPRFATGCLLVLLVFSTAAALFLCYALLMQTGLGVDALTAGSIFAPASVGFVAGSMLAPRLVARHGTPAIGAGRAALWRRHGGADAAGGRGRRRAVALVAGAGAGVAGRGAGRGQHAAGEPDAGPGADHQAGMAAGVVSTLQQVGAALGVAAAGMLFSGALEAGAGAAAGDYAQAFASALHSTWPPLRCRRCCCGGWAGAAEAGLSPPAARPAGWPSACRATGDRIADDRCGPATA